MVTIGVLVKKFSEWRKEQNLVDSQVNNYKYIWEVPQAALDEWKHALDEYQDKFTTEELNNYRTMFQVEKQLTGIYIGATSPDNYVRLYELTEYTWEFTIPDILCSTDYNIIDNSPYNQFASFPSGQTFNLPVVIKPRSVNFTTIFDGNDSPINNIWGIIDGKYFNALARRHNRLDSESIYGSINYRTGDIHLVRSNSDNERKFEKYYDDLETLVNSLDSSDSSDSDSSNDSGSSSASNSVIEYYKEHPIKPYKYVDISGQLQIIAPPIKTIFEFDIYKE